MAGDDAPVFYYVVRFASEQDAIRSIRPLDTFANTAGGRVRLQGPDRVVVWRDGGHVYLSAGALSLAGYLPSDSPPSIAPELCGPEMTPSRQYERSPMTSSERIAATALPDSAVLVVGKAVRRQRRR